MARLNSRFNYLCLVEGETVWERIKTLDGFIEGRKRAMALKDKHYLEKEADEEELAHAKENLTSWEYKRILAKNIEKRSVDACLEHEWELCEQELKELLELREHLLAIAEPTRQKHMDGTPYSNDEMYEYNAEFEFVTKLTKDVQAEILTLGRPQKATVRNLMLTPKGCEVLHAIPNLIPDGMKLIEGIAVKEQNLLSGEANATLYLK